MTSDTSSVVIEVFDPPLCCSTGVCGPIVDPTLLRFAADVRWLRENGATTRRHNLGQDPVAFTQNTVVRDTLGRIGESALPLVLLNGRIATQGRYPTREEMQSWLRSNNTTPPPPSPSPQVSSCCGNGDC